MIDQLGKYRIDGVLGQGAMGIVYRAYDPHIARTVALKTVRKDLFGAAQQSGLLERFRTEAQAAGRLNHPNIVAVYDYGEDKESAYIAMEYVDGTPLHTLLAAARPTAPERVAAWIGDLLRALAYAHARGVVHRDIKPANLLITATAQLKVGDFGVARLDTSNMTETGSMIGTPSYMSPEQFRGEAADGRADVFSAGIVLYQLLTGARPFSGTPSVVMHQIFNHTPPPPSRLHPAIGGAYDHVLERALAKHADQRYPSAQAFLDAYEAAARDSAGADPEATLYFPVERAPLADRPAAPGPAAGPPGFGTGTGTGTGGGSGSAISTVTPWKQEAFPALEAILTHQIGPMAKFLLKKIAADSDGVDALCARLLPHIPSELGRVQFQAGVDAIKKQLRASGTGTGSVIASASASLNRSASMSSQHGATAGALSHAPLAYDAACAQRIARLLTGYVGPIAQVLVKRAMRQTDDKPAFVRLLAEHIDDAGQRRRFVSEAEADAP